MLQLSLRKLVNFYFYSFVDQMTIFFHRVHIIATIKQPLKIKINKLCVKYMSPFSVSIRFIIWDLKIENWNFNHCWCHFEFIFAFFLSFFISAGVEVISYSSVSHSSTLTSFLASSSFYTILIESTDIHSHCSAV